MHTRAVSRLAHISHTPRGNVAHALLRAVSRLISTPSPASNIVSSPGVGKSADAARRCVRYAAIAELKTFYTGPLTAGADLQYTSVR